MSDQPKRPHEAVRVCVDLFKSQLSALSPEHQKEVIDALVPDVVALRRQLAEWKDHNEQRLEEVYAARALLDAQPNETLPMAIERAMLTRALRALRDSK